MRDALRAAARVPPGFRDGGPALAGRDQPALRARQAAALAACARDVGRDR